MSLIAEFMECDSCLVYLLQDSELVLCASMTPHPSTIGKVRLRLPSSIKAGDVVRVRCLVIHPMERIERDKAGKIIDKKYQYIDKVTVTYLGKTIASFDTTQSVSENPFFAFTFKATDPGKLAVTFHDTLGETYEGTADIKFG